MLNLLKIIQSLIQECTGGRYKVYLFNYSEKEEYSISVSCYPAQPPTEEIDNTMSTEYTNIQIIVQTKNSVDGIEDCLRDSDVIKKKLSGLNNYYKNNVNILKSKLNGNINFLNTTSFNIPIATMSVNINYDSMED